MALTLWSDVERGLTNTELDANFSELAAGCVAQSAVDNRPTVKPSLNLDFTKGALDPRITFTRASTATYFGADGKLKTAGVNEPRFEYDPVTRQPKGLLIEEQRTNLLTYSEQFDNAAWVKYGAVVQTNVIVSPAGNLTGCKLIGGTPTEESYPAIINTSYDLINFNSTAGSISIYAKQAELRYLVFSISRPSDNNNCGWVVDLQDTSNTRKFFERDSFSNRTITISPLGNGWSRITITGTTTTNNGYRYCLGVTDSLGTGTAPPVYTGNEVSGIYIWGAQLEAGGFATSYIPTTSDQVTRSGDAASIVGNNFLSWYRPDEGTFFTHKSNLLGGTGNTPSIFSLHTGGSANNYDPNIRQGSGDIYSVYSSSGGYSFQTSSLLALKHAFALKANDFAVSAGGATLVTDTTGILPAMDSLFFNVYYQTSEVGSFLLKKLSYYPKRLSDAQLQELTK